MDWFYEVFGIYGAVFRASQICLRGVLLDFLVSKYLLCLLLSLRPPFHKSKPQRISEHRRSAYRVSQLYARLSIFRQTFCKK